jgi:Tfp pilus assembly protein PilO
MARLNEEVEKKIILVLAFIVLLSAMVALRKTVNIVETKEKKDKKVFQYKEHKDLNLTDLRARKRLYYEDIFNQTFKSE